jgi:hypothetical protein
MPTPVFWRQLTPENILSLPMRTERNTDVSACSSRVMFRALLVPGFHPPRLSVPECNAYWLYQCFLYSAIWCCFVDILPSNLTPEKAYITEQDSTIIAELPAESKVHALQFIVGLKVLVFTPVCDTIEGNRKQ